MLILKNNLTKDDYEFASIDLKSLIQNREKSEKTLDLEKFLIPLAERGQVEAMETYCSNHSPVQTLNSKIVGNFAKLEQKSVKEPRDYMALSSLYKWYVDYYKYNYKKEDVQNLDVYKKYQHNYNLAFQELYKRGKLDPIASQYAFLLKKNNMPTDEYLRSLSNIRNKILATSVSQVKEETRLKLLYNYARNLILFAPENEYKNKKDMVVKIVSDLQKNLLVMGESRNKM